MITTLDVLKIATVTSLPTPSSSLAGALCYYSGAIYYCDGTQWTALGGGGGGGSNAWLLTGNAPSSTPTLGTTNDQDVSVVRNNTEAFRVINIGGSACLNFGASPPVYRIDLPNNSTPSIGRIRAQGYGNYSSRRWKTRIRTIRNALDIAKSIRGVRFRWRKKYGGNDDVGCIAEEVVEHVPEACNVDGSGQCGEIDYTRLVPILIEAVKELAAKVEQLERKCAR
ncbi:MAG: hypothetical protein KatS3mg038_1097 [Candidatus Kapaibacterium sp.]|nr:MAG: hypothetical protein KatS3mg038_1097 [Candidatus Kapabacteria bacterium]